MDLTAHITTFTDFALRILLYAGIGFAAIALIMLLFGSLRFVHRFPVFSMLVALGLLVGVFYWLFPEKTLAVLTNTSFYAPALLAILCLFLLSLLFRKRRKRPVPSGKAYRRRYRQAPEHAFIEDSDEYDAQADADAYVYKDAYEEEDSGFYEDAQGYGAAYEDAAPEEPAPQTTTSELAELYRYFNLPQGAPFADVKKAYYTMQKEMHPDLYQDKPRRVQNLLNANIQQANANYMRLKKLLNA